MTLTELRYIIAVERYMHFGKAAVACFVSQPTLSVAIKKLEEELGVIIFERGMQEIKPTSIGKKIVTQAQQILEQAEAIKQLASEGKHQLNEPLKLGVIYTVGPYLLPHLIPVLRELAPDMPVIIREDYTANLRTALKNGEIDVAILALPFSEPGLKSTLLYTEPFVFAFPSDHPWATRKTIDHDDIKDETLLLLGSGNCFREQVIEVCPDCVSSNKQGAHGLARTLEGSSLETIRQMAASGTGVSILPITSTGKGMDLNGLITYRPFSKPEPSRDIVLVWRNSFPRIEAVRSLYKAIIDSPVKGIYKADQETLKEKLAG